MVSTGEAAPGFTVPLANGDVRSFSLADRLDEAPLVFVFFPGAFTDTCSDELSAFEGRRGAFDTAGASIYGVSVDLPFAQNALREELGLRFGLLSDSSREIVDAWDLSMDFDHLGVDDVAKRAVVVVDGDGVVQSAWVSDDPGVEPDYDAVLEAVESLSAEGFSRSAR